MVIGMFDSVLNVLSHGLSGWTWWQVTIYTLIVTHLTIIGVTLFLHRAQAHRARSAELGVDELQMEAARGEVVFGKPPTTCVHHD